MCAAQAFKSMVRGTGSLKENLLKFVSWELYFSHKLEKIEYENVICFENLKEEGIRTNRIVERGASPK